MFNYLIVATPTERWGSQAVGDESSCVITAKSAEDAKREFCDTYGNHIHITECIKIGEVS